MRGHFVEIGARLSKQLPLAAIVVLPWAVTAVLGPMYETNDDAGNILLFREFFGDASLDSSIFVSTLLSKALILLYRAAGSIPWYPLLLYFCLVAAQFIVVHLLYTRIRLNPYLRVFLIAAFSVEITRIALCCSFTASSLLLCNAAILLGLLNSNTAPRRSWPVAMFFLTLGFLLRPSVFPLVILSFAPALATAVFCRAIRLRECAAWLALVITVVVSLGVFDHALQSDAAKAYERTSLVRAAFSDSVLGLPQDGNDLQPALDAAGWTFEDYAVLQELWWYTDKSVYSLDAIERFTETARSESAWPWSATVLRYSLGQSDSRYSFFFYLVAMMGWLVLGNGQRRAWFWISLSAGLCCTVLIAGIRFPARVAFPFFTLLMLAPLAGYAMQEKRTNILPRRAVAACAAICVALAGIMVLDLSGILLHKNDNERRAAALSAGMGEVARSNPDTLFVPLLFNGHSQEKFIRPFEWQALNKTIPSGCAALGPVGDSHLLANGFDTDNPIVPQMLGDEDVVWYFLARDSDMWWVIRPFFKYLDDHYGRGVGRPQREPTIVKLKKLGTESWVFVRFTEVGALRSGAAN